jgi:hypothetical protein
MARRNEARARAELTKTPANVVMLPTVATAASYRTESGVGRLPWRVGVALWPAVATGVAALLAISVRISRPVPWLPLNDGALFFLMSQKSETTAFTSPCRPRTTPPTFRSRIHRWASTSPRSSTPWQASI